MDRVSLRRVTFRVRPLKTSARSTSSPLVGEETLSEGSSEKEKLLMRMIREIERVITPLDEIMRMSPALLREPPVIREILRMTVQG